MKKKLYKILGVALTATLLASLMVGTAVTPASADELEWSTVRFPKAGLDEDGFRDPLIDGLGPLAQAIDGTLYMGAEYDGGPLLIKSEDAGRAWEEVNGYGPGGVGGDQIYAIECSSEDADVVYVADASDEVFKTSNGGRDFVALADMGLAGGERITDLSLAFMGSDPILFASTAIDGPGGGDVYVLPEATYPPSWGAMDIDSDRAASWGADANVWAVEASPTFDSDQMIVAIATDVSATATFATTNYSGAAWAATLDDAAIEYGNTTAIDAVYSATIFLPGEFDSDAPEYFVGLACFDPLEGDVYRIVTDSAFDQDISGNGTATNVTGLDGVGNAGAAVMLAGGNNPDDDDDIPVTWFSEDNGDGWDEARKAPTGADMYIGQALVSVAVFDDFADSGEALAATVGTDCAVSHTANSGTTWNQISMINTDMSDLEAFHTYTGSAKFLITENGGDDSLWRHLDGDWERVLLKGDLDFIDVAPDDTDVVFVANDGGMIWRSTNGGNSFKPQLSAPPEDITAMIALDSSTLVLGADGETQKTTNNGTTWETKPAGDDDIIDFALSPDFDADETILASDDGGGVWISDNAGNAPFDELAGPPSDFDGNTYVAFHPDYANNGVLFGAGVDDGGDLLISRWAMGDWWENIGTGTGIPATGIAVGADGTLYVSADGAEGVGRCLDPLAKPAHEVEWQDAAGGSLGFDGGEYIDTGAHSQNGLIVTAGSNILWGIGDSMAGPPGSQGPKVWTFEDTLTGQTVPSTPLDDGETGRETEVSLAWDDMDGARGYEYEVNTDAGFDGVVIAAGSVDVTTVRITVLDAGQTYYWRVRADDPLWSNWSDTWSFNTAFGAGEWNPFVGGIPEAPANGATNVPLLPTFAWNRASWASGYSFELSANPDYSDPIVSKVEASSLDGTVYLCEVELEYGTTYYWRVRAGSPTSHSEWAEAVFTTMDEPPAPPPPPDEPPPPPPPTTPAYIWVIIGVGALLVIAVIVLIITTRRRA